MASLLSKRIRLEAKKFNKLRSKTTGLATDGAPSAFLLTRNAKGTGFNSEYEVINWMWDYSDFREKAVLMIATELDELVAKIRIASHFSIEGQVYEIGERDIVQPTMKVPYWRIYGDYIPKTYSPA
jgi:hypothetical protein